MFCMSRKASRFLSGLRATSTYNTNKLLSLENRQRTMAKLLNMKPIRLQTQEPIKRAAIFVPVCVAKNKVCLLYIVKQTILTEHKEQVNFPGDIQQSNDNNAEDTVLRTAETLLGLNERNIQIWGTGKIIVARADFTFIPVIGEIIGNFNHDRLTLNECVEEVFTVPVEDLCNTKTNAYTQFKDEYSSPVFMGGKWRIWGFTAMITNIILKSLVPSQGYTHRVKHVPSIKRGTKFPRTVKNIRK